MVDATPGPVYGDNARLYYSATLGGAGALTHLECAISHSVNRERRSSEVAYRGLAEIAEHVGKSKNSISVQLMTLVGSPSTTYLAMRSAFDAKTVLHFASATGDITEVGAQVTRMEGQIKSWVESEPDNGNVTVDIEIVRAPSSTYASTISVVAA